jgi:hypothetical protein
MAPGEEGLHLIFALIVMLVPKFVERGTGWARQEGAFNALRAPSPAPLRLGIRELANDLSIGMEN